MSSAVSPFVVRKRAANATGRALIISEMSDDTRPASANSSSAHFKQRSFINCGDQLRYNYAIAVTLLGAVRAGRPPHSSSLLLQPRLTPSMP